MSRSTSSRRARPRLLRSLVALTASLLCLAGPIGGVAGADGGPTPPPAPSSPSGPADIGLVPAALVPVGGIELPQLRDRDLMSWLMPDGHVRAVAVAGTNYRVPGGAWEPVDLAFAPRGGTWVADQNDFVATATPDAVSIADAGGHAVAWQGRLQSVTGSRAVLDIGGDDWTFTNVRDGMIGTTSISQRRGARTYDFAADIEGAALALTPEGALSSASLRIEHPFALGADGKRYEAGGWQVEGTTLSFSFDDSTLPDGALPYLLDPTVSFPQPAFYGYMTVRSTSYPPGPADAARATTYPMDHLLFGTSWYNNDFNDGIPYWSDEFFTRWDTSSIPDGVTIQAASVTAFIMSWRAVDGRNVVADWYDPGPAIGAEDYQATFARSAVSYPISSLPAAGNNGYGPGADQTFTLTNPKFVDSTGTSSLRWGVDVGAPTGWNTYVFSGNGASMPDGYVNGHGPVLTVDYVCEECGPVQPGMGGMENLGAQASSLPPVRPADLPTDDTSTPFDQAAKGTPLPSCRAITYRGNAGEISVQINPFSGSVQWGIHMFREPDNYGHWIVDLYVGKKRFDHKDQWYNPHGSIPASLAKPGSHIRIMADLYALQLNGETAHFFNVPNECVVP